MKSFTLFFFLQSCIYFGLQAQTNNYTPLSPSYIVLANGADTLHHVKIIKNKRKTNEQQVTYKSSTESKKTVAATDVVAYFDGLGKYNSTKTKGTTKLIRFPYPGPLNYGISYQKNKTATFYLQKEGEETPQNLAPYKYELDLFLANYLTDYQNFRKVYNRKTHYTSRSISELATAYNEFKNPEKYQFVKYQPEESIKFGLVAAYNFYTFSLNDEPISFKQKTAYSAGLLIQLNYLRNISFNFTTLYNSARYESTLAHLRHKNLSFEFAPLYNLYYTERMKLSIAPGLVAVHNLNSEYEYKAEQEIVSLYGWNIGYTATVHLAYQQKTVFTLSYLYHPVQLNTFTPTSIDSEGDKGSIRGVKIGAMYIF